MQPPLSAMRQCAASNSPFRLSAICVASVTGGAAMCRFKFAFPIVGDMRNLRYRRLQYDNADSEFGDLKKPNIKKIHCFQAVDFLLVTQYSFCPLPCFLANLIHKRTPTVSDRCPLLLIYNAFTSSSLP